MIHHLNKPGRGGYGRSRRSQQGELKARVSGHSAFVNRPRLVLAMEREADGPDSLTRIGIVKQNVGLGHVEDVMENCTRDPVTYRHLPSSAPERSRRKQAATPASNPAANTATPAGSPDEAARVLAALTRIVGEGGTVMSTGKRELHALGAPELVGLSRARLRELVAQLIADGRVQKNDDGALQPAAAEVTSS